MTGPETDTAIHDSRLGPDRDGDAAHAGLLLLLVEGVAARAHQGEVGQQGRLGHQGVLGLLVEADPTDDLADPAVGELAEQRLADAGAVQVDLAADLGEHPHRVPRRHLGDVLGVGAGEDRQVGRLAERVDQPTQDTSVSAPTIELAVAPSGTSRNPSA